MDTLTIEDSGFSIDDILKWKRFPAELKIQVVQVRGTRILLETLKFITLGDMDEAFDTLNRGGKPIKEERGG